MAKIKEILGQRYVLNEDDPYSRQIIMGRNGNNQKAYRYANATTDNLGLARREFIERWRKRLMSQCRPIFKDQNMIVRFFKLFIAQAIVLFFRGKEE